MPEPSVVHSPKTKDSRFARIDNAALQDGALSFRARGVLAFILSLPADKRHNAESLAGATAGEGRDAVRAALRELADRGYAARRTVRSDAGHLVSYWTFQERPKTENQEPVTVAPKTENQDVEPTPEKPATGQPTPGGPEDGKPGDLETTEDQTTLSRATSTNCRASAFVDWFLQLLNDDGVKVSLTTSSRASWADCYNKMIRIDGRTDEQIRSVCMWARQDSFWRTNFLSPMKLRDKKDGVMWFDAFVVKMSRPADGRRNARSFSLASSYAGITDK